MAHARGNVSRRRGGAARVAAAEARNAAELGPGGRGRWFANPGRMSQPAQTELASLFTDHAVLQAERAWPIWGWDAPGRNLLISLHGAGGEVAAWLTQADATG